MPRGGVRPGSGRPKGARSKLQTEITKRAVASGITPLEVMMQAMREAYDAGDMSAAAGYAEKAAPYCHARLSSVEQKSEVRVTYAVEVPLVAPTVDEWLTNRAPPRLPS